MDNKTPAELRDIYRFNWATVLSHGAQLQSSDTVLSYS